MNQIDNKVPLVYISDRGEDGKESAIYKWLEHHFKNVELYATDSHTDVAEMIADLERISAENYFEKEMDTILIGNAYGGFVANLLGGTTVLINPILSPSETLTDLTDEKQESLRHWESQRSEPRSNVYTICSESDAQIVNNLLPLLERLNEPSYHIVKLCCDSMAKLKAGEVCKGYSYRFDQRYHSHKEAKMELMRLIRQESKVDSHTVIGYKIQEIYGENVHNVYRQWSYTPDGWFIAESYHNSKVEFNGREPHTLPFLKGDYVIAHYNKDLILGKIVCEPHTPAKVAEIKKEKQAMSEDEPIEMQTDSLVDGYCIDFNGLTGLVSVANVFPLPFDIKVKNSHNND